MQLEEARGQFLDSLYAAAVGATGWRPVLETFASIMDAPNGAINFWDPYQTRCNHAESLNTSETFQQKSQDYWLAHEPWARRGFEMVAQNPARARKGFVFHGSAEVPTSHLLETPWYRDFAREYDMQDCLGLSACTTQGHFISVSGITGSKRGRLFTADAVSLAKMLKSDFGRALTLHIELSKQRARSSASSQWQSTPVPVLVLREGTILQANEAALEAMESGDIVKKSRGKGVLIADATLANLAKTHQYASGTPHATHLATGRSGTRWLAQLVRFNQLAGSLLGTAGIDDPAILLALTPLDTAAETRKLALQSLAILSPAEKEIALCLLNGDSIAKISRTNRKSEETIRWHVRNMIEKTGCRNLADLTRTLSLLLPL